MRGCVQRLIRLEIDEARSSVRAPHRSLLTHVLVSLCCAALFSGCERDHGNYFGGCQTNCECSGPECLCPTDGACEMECLWDCNLECTGTEDCYLGCDEGCVATCNGSGDCSMNVGEGSTVSCMGSGDCMIGCSGDCHVDCKGSGDCVVRCHNGADCSSDACEESAIQCVDGTVVCGGDCLIAE